MPATRSLSDRGLVAKQTLGQGTYAVVHLVKREEDGKYYAVKVVDISKLNHKDVANALHEVRVLSCFNHPRIVHVYDSFFDVTRRELYVVMEFCPYRDLSHKIKRYRERRDRLDERVIWVYVIQIMEALAVLHEVNVLHRDLKPANCLMAENGSIKLADYNIARVITEPGEAMTTIGTPYYMAPEVWLGNGYGTAADIWSAGCTIYELGALQHAFQAGSMTALKASVIEGRVVAPFPEHYSQALRDLVSQLMSKDPARRPSAQQVLESPEVQARLSLVRDKLPRDLPPPEPMPARINPMSLTLDNIASHLPPSRFPTDDGSEAGFARSRQLSEASASSDRVPSLDPVASAQGTPEATPRAPRVPALGFDGRSPGSSPTAAGEGLGSARPRSRDSTSSRDSSVGVGGGSARSSPGGSQRGTRTPRSSSSTPRTAVMEFPEMKGRDFAYDREDSDEEDHGEDAPAQRQGKGKGAKGDRKHRGSIGSLIQAARASVFGPT
jgi:serine/threonine protein kinase